MERGGRERTPRGGLWRLIAATLLFGAGYAVANRFQLTQSIAYRLAAGDPQSALIALLFMAFQGAILLAALFLFPRRWAAALLTLAGVSILINIGYSQIVGALLDAGSLAWMLAETGQAGNAAGEFGAEFLWVAAQVAAALSLFVAARMMARGAGRMPWGRGIAATLLALLVLPGLLHRHAAVWPEAAERNLYGLGWELATAAAPPPRAEVTLKPEARTDTPRHIVWVIDESVAEAPFRRLIVPKLAGVAHSDFGIAAAMGHCSAPVQVALRSGVDVRRVSAASDLRATPSIWAYAEAAGYRTLLIDGQTSGRRRI